MPKHIRSAAAPERNAPPTLALPHEGGGDHKLLCTYKLLLIQWY